MRACVPACVRARNALFVLQLLLAVWLSPHVFTLSSAENSWCLLLNNQQCCLQLNASMSCCLATHGHLAVLYAAEIVQLTLHTNG